MEYVFPALERRFNRDSFLRRFAQKLFLGSTEEVRNRRNYVEVVSEGIDHAFDTFDSDEPVYDLRFTIYTKSDRPIQCAQIMRHMHRAFKDADLESEHFDTCGMLATGEIGPTLVNGTYQAEMTFKLHVSLKTLVPVVRERT